MYTDTILQIGFRLNGRYLEPYRGQDLFNAVSDLIDICKRKMYKIAESEHDGDDVIVDIRYLGICYDDTVSVVACYSENGFIADMPSFRFVNKMNAVVSNETYDYLHNLDEIGTDAVNE